MAKRRPTTLRIGSVSSGTLRPEDLIPSFLWECNRLYLSHYERHLVRNIARAFHALPDEWSDEQVEQAGYLLEELTTFLEAHTPDYCTFGSHPGDGADFGVWPDWDALDDVFKGERADAARTDYFCLELNDHGNATLYHRAGNRWVECWSVV